MELIEALRQTRHNLLITVEAYTIDEMNVVPEGFNNSLLWNLGHVWVTQKMLHYGLSGLPLNIEDELVNQFRKGSKAIVWKEETLSRIKSDFLQSVDDLERDLNANIFKEFRPYRTSYNVELESLDDALWFNNMHEAMHLGYMLAMRKSIK
jgi:hypothetical protein